MSAPDPYEAGPPEYQPDEDPGDDDRALWAEAAAEWDRDFGFRFAYLSLPWGPVKREADDG